MSIHDRLEAFWSGEKPDCIPYTIYYWELKNVADDPAWQAMYKAGLGVTWHVSVFGSQMRDVETENTNTTENGVPCSRRILKTPVGKIHEMYINGWRQEYLLKSAQDYRVMTWIVRHTQVKTCYDAFEKAAGRAGPQGVLLTYIGRTPFQTMLVDMAGLENFSLHLFDYEAEVRELYVALLEQFARIVDIVASGPGRFVSNLENFTAESVGRARYAEFLLPVYEKYFPILQQAGKIVGSHYDGRTACCKDLIAKAPIDLIESLTEPSEGDMTLAECRATWPDKLFWVNIRVGDYQLPPARLREKVHALIKEAAPDGRRLAFECSEHLPQNWKESMPVVLDALNEGIG